MPLRPPLAHVASTAAAAAGMIASVEPAADDAGGGATQVGDMVRVLLPEEGDGHEEDLEGQDDDEERAGVAGDAVLPVGGDDPQGDFRAGGTVGCQWSDLAGIGIWEKLENDGGKREAEKEA